MVKYGYKEPQSNKVLAGWSKDKKKEYKENKKTNAKSHLFSFNKG